MTGPVYCTYCGRKVASNQRPFIHDPKPVPEWMQRYDRRPKVRFAGHRKCWVEMTSNHNDPTRWDVKEGK